jgi:hypothetical protein
VYLCGGTLLSQGRPQTTGRNSSARIWSPSHYSYARAGGPLAAAVVACPRMAHALQHAVLGSAPPALPDDAAGAAYYGARAAALRLLRLLCQASAANSAALTSAGAAPGSQPTVALVESIPRLPWLRMARVCYKVSGSLVSASIKGPAL